MAAGTSRLLNRITTVGFLKRGLRAIVATKAEDGLPFDEKVPLIRTVGKVARAAPLRSEEGLVDDLLLVLFLPVTGVTNLVCLSPEQVPRRRSMGLMAHGALASREGRMDMGLLKAEFLSRMTRVAEVIALLLEEKFRKETMAKMTRFTSLLLHDGVNLLHPQVAIRELRVTVETVLRGESLSLRGIELRGFPPGNLAVNRKTCSPYQQECENGQEPNVSIESNHTFPRLGFLRL